jgi:hypothetical protein
MTETEILYSALKIAGQYARKYLPAEMPNDIEYVKALIDGAEDPEGEKFIWAWINKAISEGLQ